MSEKNITGVIEKKVVIDENQNTEKIIESIVENQNEEKINEDTNQEIVVDIKNQVLIALIKIIDISVSRGAFKANEVGNVGKVYKEFKDQLDKESEESKVLVTSLNNIRILIEIVISRGVFLAEELSDVGDLYNIILSLI